MSIKRMVLTFLLCFFVLSTIMCELTNTSQVSADYTTNKKNCIP